MIVEVAVEGIDEAIEAQRLGANRIELCADLLEGGTTPSYGIIKTVREKLTIPIFVMIRPRGGNFIYSSDEFESMKYDIEISKELGCEGVVLGLLNNDGSINLAQTEELIQLAAPMKVTFHRAFDVCSTGPIVALEQLKTIGVNRLLTSGQTDTAEVGIPIIKQLVQQAGDDLCILPGKGVNASNAAQIITETGANEIHFTSRKKVGESHQFDAEKLKSIQKVLS